MKLLKNKTVCILTCILILLFVNNSFSQGYGDKWVIGSPNVWVSFDTTYHLDYSDTAYLTCGTALLEEGDDICDRYGNVQFFYNGTAITSYKIYNTMDNGDSLDCCLSLQTYGCSSSVMDASIIIPSSLDSNKYFVFQTNIDTTVVYDSNGDFYWVPSKMLKHTIDMSLNNGDGKVVSKNEVVYRQRYLLMRLAAVRHGNGRDWWIVGHGYDVSRGNNTFYIWLIKNDSVQSPLIQQIGSFIYMGLGWEGNTTFNPDGSKLAMVTVDDTLNVFDFDRCAGVLSNAQKIYLHDSVPSSVGQEWLNSCAFSSDSRFLYTDEVNSTIRQFDMSISNLDSSTVVGQYNFNLNCYSYSSRVDGFGEMQLAPDGKIYIVPYEDLACMSLIEKPDVKGTGCGFVQNAFYPYPNYRQGLTLLSLPNMPNYQLGALAGSACDTINGVENIKANTENIKVFPNPANDLINIEVLNGATPDNISIIDVTGRIWKQFKPSQPSSQINIANLQAGVYFIQIKMATRVMVSKLVKE